MRADGNDHHALVVAESLPISMDSAGHLP